MVFFFPSPHIMMIALGRSFNISTLCIWAFNLSQRSDKGCQTKKHSWLMYAAHSLNRRFSMSEQEQRLLQGLYLLIKTVQAILLKMSLEYSLK